MRTAVRRKRWTCFHCDESFTTKRSAREHFGDSEESRPACKIKAGAEGSLLRALRASERALADAWAIIHNESSDAQRALAATCSRHFQQLQSAEETGYERGVRDGILYERSGDAAKEPAGRSMRYDRAARLSETEDARYREWARGEAAG